MMFEVCFRNKLPLPSARLIYQSAQAISDKTVSNFMEYFVERRSLLNENAVQAESVIPNVGGLFQK